jgi:hypothetical protein
MNCFLHSRFGCATAFTCLPAFVNEALLENVQCLRLSASDRSGCRRGPSDKQANAYQQQDILFHRLSTYQLFISISAFPRVRGAFVLGSARPWGTKCRPGQMRPASRGRPPLPLWCPWPIRPWAGRESTLAGRSPRVRGHVFVPCADGRLRKALARRSAVETAWSTQKGEVVTRRGIPFAHGLGSRKGRRWNWDSLEVPTGRQFIDN